MKTKGIIYRKRQFLNKIGHHKGAFILAEIEKSIYKGMKNKKTGKRALGTISHYFTLQLADCSRMIDLELEMGTKSKFINSVHKLQILINVLTEMKSIMEKEFIEKEKLIKQKKIQRDRW